MDRYKQQLRRNVAPRNPGDEEPKRMKTENRRAREPGLDTQTDIQETNPYCHRTGRQPFSDSGGHAITEIISILVP